MSASITDRVSRPLPDRPVQQAKPVQEKRAETADMRNQPTRAVQEDKAAASRNADKGQHVDRYA